MTRILFGLTLVLFVGAGVVLERDDHPVLAEGDTGLYLEADGGYAIPESFDLTEDGLNGDVELDDT
jgi:hypothetical protein